MRRMNNLHGKLPRRKRSRSKIIKGLTRTMKRGSTRSRSRRIPFTKQIVKRPKGRMAT